MANKTTITVSLEVHSKLKEIKEKIGVPNIDLALRWLLKLPPFGNSNIEKQIEKKEVKNKHKEVEELSYHERLKQAVKYVNKIVKEDGKISEEKLYKVIVRFKVSKEDLLREASLLMKEPGVYYQI